MAVAASGPVVHGDPRVLEAVIWGLVSALSLNIGSAIGVTCLPSQKFCAILMSFGGGALLFALTIELFGHQLHVAEMNGENDSVVIMIVAAIMGGMLFATLNRILNSKGADLRKPSLSKARFGRLRSVLGRRLVRRIHKYAIFSGLTMAEMNDLMISAMYKKCFAAGEEMLDPSQAELNVYFILNGTVLFDILEDPAQREGGTGTSEEEVIVESFQLGINGIFGEMSLRRATAVERTTVLVLPAQHLTGLIERNESVRNAMALRMLQRLRRIHGLPPLEEDLLAELSLRVVLKTFQPDEKVFEGPMNQCPFAICVAIGSLTVKQAGALSQDFHANQILTLERLIYPAEAVEVLANEATTVIQVHLSDIELISEQHKLFTPTIPTVVTVHDQGLRVPSKKLMATHSIGEDAVLPGQPNPAEESCDSSLSDGRRTIGLAWLGADTNDEESQATPYPSPKGFRPRLPSKDRIIFGLLEGMTRQTSSMPTALVTDEELAEQERLPLADRGGLKVLDAQTTGQLTSTESGHEHPESSHVAIMVWLGILIDAIPESLVIGILVNKANGDASKVLPFIMGVFLSNLPESMSSSGMMKAHGMKVVQILSMWLTITVLTCVGALIGALVFPPGSDQEPSTQLIVAGVEGLAAGAMLTMIAQTMMPEAFGQGGDVVGMACLAGFLTALATKLIDF